MGRWIDLARAKDGEPERVPLAFQKTQLTKNTHAEVETDEGQHTQEGVDWVNRVNWKPKEPDPAPRALDPDSPTARKVARLPTHPPTCALCGVSDWLVAMTDRAGRKLHVECWKAEGGTA